MPAKKINQSRNTAKNFTYAKVVFPLPVDREFVYNIPDELQKGVAPGCIIAAPFRNGIKTGFVTGITERPPVFAVKDIQDMLYDLPVFTKEMIELARWMSTYYFTSVGDILQVMLPVKLKRESVELLTPGPNAESGIPQSGVRLTDNEKTILEFVRKRGRVTPKAVRLELGRYHLYHSLDKLMQNNLISIQQVISSRKVKPKKNIYYRPCISLSFKKQGELFSRAVIQKDIYNYILTHNPVSRKQVVLKFPGKEHALQSLQKKGLIEKYEQEISREYLVSEKDFHEALPPLNDAQKVVVNRIETETDDPARREKVFLVHGVTGSGKTRVYLELIRSSLSRNHGVLFLVPEIALTNYFLSNLRAQFGGHVAVLHSRMSRGERYDSWRAIVSGKKRLVIGPRSAVFAPVSNLKLIIVDEEHDTSYKQHESPPYYHARDIAVYRGKITGARVVLGSATPSMESYHNALSGKYTLLSLPERIDRTPLPEVRLISLHSKNGEYIKRKESIFSEELIAEIERRLKKDEQVLLMQNRRGYSTFIQCRNCGYIETCKHCKITMTFHKRLNKITCHFCGYQSSVPQLCPECRGADIRYSGIGTQQVEETLKKMLPGYHTIRMDLDTTRTKSAHRHITGGFERGESDVLVGTQMIAKGFDFARVNLVGVVSADTGLLLPEFRAAEKTFQLMTQAAGRAGRRREQGLVLIQTNYPEHYSLVAAKNHDFHIFYEQESKNRRDLQYPPFGRIILLRFSGRDERQVEDAATEIGKVLRHSGYKHFLLGPAPAPIEKIRNRYRWQIFLKSGKSADPNGRKIRAAAYTAREEFSKLPQKRSVIMNIDVDPVNLL